MSTDASAFERNADGFSFRRILPAEYAKWLADRGLPRTYNRRYPRCSHPLSDDELPESILIRSREIMSGSPWRRCRKFFMDVSDAQWIAIKEFVIGRAGGKCEYCDGKAVTADHVIAFVELGASHPNNLRAVCLQCNSSKGSTPLTAWKGRT